MIRRPPRSTHCISSAASDVYKRQVLGVSAGIIVADGGASVGAEDSVAAGIEGIVGGWSRTSRHCRGLTLLAALRAVCGTGTGARVRGENAFPGRRQRDGPRVLRLRPILSLSENIGCAQDDRGSSPACSGFGMTSVIFVSHAAANNLGRERLLEREPGAALRWSYG